MSVSIKAHNSKSSSKPPEDYSVTKSDFISQPRTSRWDSWICRTGILRTGNWRTWFWRT